MLASFITLLQTTMSFLIWSANFVDVLPTGWKLNLSSVALKSGSCTISVICFCRSAMILRRGAGRCHHAVDQVGFLVRDAGFAQGRNLRESRRPRRAGHGERPQFVRVQIRRNRRQREEDDLGVARQGRIDSRRGAVERHADQAVELERQLEQAFQVNWPNPMPIAA